MPPSDTHSSGSRFPAKWDGGGGDGTGRTIDTLEAEAFGPLGEAPLCLVDLNEPGAVERAAHLSAMTQAVVVGIDPQGKLPRIDSAPFDALFTAAPEASRPWVSIEPGRWDARLAAIADTVRAAPAASSIAMRVLRIGENLAFEDALQLESLAYSTLLGGGEFRRWRAERAASDTLTIPADPVEIMREGDTVTIALASPETRNAMSAAMRDALFTALAAVLDDPTAPHMRLTGQGACFSTGGDLPEFGTAGDLALAHAIRSARSCAALLHRLGDRAKAVLHGACIGSGIEIPAAAARRIGRRGAFFQLPELTMGLIPGAGGTVTLPRAIGRHRTAAMILTAKRVDAKTALDWGLLTGLEP
ncbi:MAG: enoyl-CoA hydratase/isomerase family protein [Novosphingobium sp.]|nr:enoyl-CoA hydratase/isomerase family protein [Novosphingobium sp.]